MARIGASHSDLFLIDSVLSDELIVLRNVYFFVIKMTSFLILVLFHVLAVSGDNLGMFSFITSLFTLLVRYSILYCSSQLDTLTLAAEISIKKYVPQNELHVYFCDNIYSISGKQFRWTSCFFIFWISRTSRSHPNWKSSRLKNFFLKILRWKDWNHLIINVSIVTWIQKTKGTIIKKFFPKTITDMNIEWELSKTIKKWLMKD